MLCFGGLMGWIKYIVPIGTFAIGIVLTRESKKFVIPKISQFVVIILCICALMSSFQISSKELDISDNFSNLISNAYDKGVVNKGGGAIRCTNCHTYDKNNRCGFICCANWSCNSSFDIYIWN
ncbi:MAG: hypothetical protein K2H53_07365 [Clostridia bacterium]|nr:hypothetical protein [Clostridia bacterium]